MKTLATLSIIVFFNLQILSACSCGGFSSFAESVREKDYVTAIIEFQVISTQTNFINVKILNDWKGPFLKGQEIKIWNFERRLVSSCGHPGISLNNFAQNTRFISAIRLKEGSTFDFEYDTAGQAYIPLFACGYSTLKVEEDSVKGVTFGIRTYNVDRANTFEFDMLYVEFIARFSQILSVNDDAELISDNISFYPNPAKDKIYIRSLSEGSIKVYNSGLSELFSGTLNNNQTIDVSKFSPGIYMIECIVEDKKILSKFVKE